MRLISVAIIFFAPVFSSWQQLRAERSVYPLPDVAGLDVHSRAVAAYIAQRDPAVDSLLPHGEGGTHFVASMDSAAGRAIAANALILLASNVSGVDESVELHERAHLLHAYLPGEVARLMMRLPAPADGEYAATNLKEHFAEMASVAWSIISPRDDVCLIGSPTEQLRAAEERVPGTSGFVSWFLRSLPRQPSDTMRELLAESTQLAAPVRAEWDAIWAALEKRRRPDGSFESWKTPDIASHLNAWRAEEWNSGKWFGKVVATLLAPGELLANIF